MTRKKSAANHHQVKQQQENRYPHEGNIFLGEDFFQGKQYQQCSKAKIKEVGLLGGKEQSPGQEK